MNSKRKGNAGERELLAILSEHGEAIRNDQTYIGGKGNPDIAFTDGSTRYHVECKRAERLNIHAAIQQAERDADPADIPIVAHRRNHEDWYITMRLRHFLQALKGGVKHE